MGRGAPCRASTRGLTGECCAAPSRTLKQPPPLPISLPPCNGLDLAPSAAAARPVGRISALAHHAFQLMPFCHPWPSAKASEAKTLGQANRLRRTCRRLCLVSNGNFRRSCHRGLADRRPTRAARLALLSAGTGARSRASLQHRSPRSHSSMIADLVGSSPSTLTSRGKRRLKRPPLRL